MISSCVPAVVEFALQRWCFSASLLRTFEASSCWIELRWLLLWKKYHCFSFYMYCFNVAHVFYEMRDSSSCDILMCNNIANSFFVTFCFCFEIQNEIWESRKLKRIISKKVFWLTKLKMNYDKFELPVLHKQDIRNGRERTIQHFLVNYGSWKRKLVKYRN